jgi:hypothetical protein
MSGYYVMPRGWMDMPALDAPGEAFCRRAAWVWLIEKARWADGPVNIQGKTVHLQRGQMTFSTRFLATSWGWPQTTVRRFLERLTRDGAIECSGSGQMVITVCNYGDYTLQEDDDGSDSAQEWLSDGSNKNKVISTVILNGHSEVTQDPNVIIGRGTVTPLPLTVRADDESGQSTLLPTASVVSVPTIAMQFEEFYRIYPKKKKKPEALAAYRRALNLISHEELLEAVKRFPWDGNVKYYPYPASWLNGQRWLDEPDATKKPAPENPRGEADSKDPLRIQAWCKKLTGVKHTSSAAEKANGNWIAYGWIVDAVANSVAEAAELPPDWLGSWEPLQGWLEAGYEPDAIVAAITKAIESLRRKGQTYTPGSLKLFSAWVDPSRKVA